MVLNQKQSPCRKVRGFSFVLNTEKPALSEETRAWFEDYV
ncbi:hypothetical protein bas26_0082 [Escherichia phage GreteKellenberger]|uniref:Uncharacterized protein n=2 Tax=Epseptimavirus TaxID=2732017 RepID=A0AAE7VTN4_9CAUD|nr:hypothetical protein bas26_0082 [Escherichia phage GreteKellenberger]QXV80438.1 hypothetical protein bas28_0086 [Escherichia phage IrmaTschudi]